MEYRVKKRIEQERREEDKEWLMMQYGVRRKRIKMVYGVRLIYIKALVPVSLNKWLMDKYYRNYKKNGFRSSFKILQTAEKNSFSRKFCFGTSCFWNLKMGGG